MAAKAASKKQTVETAERTPEEKKKALPEYRKARDEMRELLTVKANVESILRLDEHDHGKKHVRE